jgi:CRISPR system Cascade subunit CasB
MTSPPQSRAAALVAHLHALVEREDRGALAALRRGLGKEPGTVPDMYRHVEPYLGGGSIAEMEAAYVVACLFGLHPVPWKASDGHVQYRNFGWSLRHVRRRADGSEDEGVARRFLAALNSDREALPVHLRQLVSLLRSKGEQTPVNWERLYWDIVDWDRADRRVQRRWAEAFWRGGGHTTSEDAEAAESPQIPSVDEDE